MLLTDFFMYSERYSPLKKKEKQKLSKAVTDIKNNLTPSVQALRDWSKSIGGGGGGGGPERLEMWLIKNT